MITDTIDKVNSVNSVPVLCGAGVKDCKDVAVAIKLGAVGVLVASHVVKAEDPAEILLELARGIKNGN